MADEWVEGRPLGLFTVDHTFRAMLLSTSSCVALASYSGSRVAASEKRNALNTDG